MPAIPDSTPVSRTLVTPRHTTRYIEAGPPGGPLMVFLHGWPELGLVWRAQVDAFAAEGWRCVAPDMRGYGGSSAPAATDAYTMAQIVADVAELHDHLGGAPAVWVGHDWGSVVAGALVAHHPGRARGAVLVSVPYFPDANALPTLVPLVDRTIYPADQYPDGQWDYYRYYNTHLTAAVADLDADQAASLASIYRSGDPSSLGRPAANATVTRRGGRFGAAHRAPPTQPDPALWPAADFEALVHAFAAHGFRAPLRLVPERRRQHRPCAPGTERRPPVAAGAVRERRPRPDERHHRQPSGRPDARGLRGPDRDQPARRPLAAAGVQGGPRWGDPHLAAGQGPGGPGTLTPQGRAQPTDRMHSRSQRCAGCDSFRRCQHMT